ncbi:MAG: alpha/beta fold hydrolase [Myxococcota bacterium]
MSPDADTHWLKSRDGLPLRLVQFSTVGRPALVCTGRNESIEKYAHVAATLTERGYAVSAVDWRGQGLSGRETTKVRRGHVGSFESYLDDLSTVLAAIEAAPLVFAHSMGGHIALRYAHLHRSAFSALVLTSPMIEIRTGPLPGAAVRFLAGAAQTVGLAEAYLPGHRRLMERRFAGNVLTENRERFEWIARLHREQPELVTGGATFGWLAAAIESMEHLGASGVAEAIRTPTLIASAGKDRVVSNRAHRRFAGRMPHAHHVTIPGARHELPQETDARLHQLWTEVDGFFTSNRF